MLSSFLILEGGSWLIRLNLLNISGEIKIQSLTGLLEWEISLIYSKTMSNKNDIENVSYIPDI